MSLQPLQCITQNPNPTIVRSSSHACVLFFLPVVSLLACACVVFPSSGRFPCACFLSQKRLAFLPRPLACLQQAHNTDMWLVLSHLSFVCFLDLLGDCLELFLELCYTCLRLHSLLLECVHYLECNFITDQFHALFLGL
jgi:hypothetical protein